MAGKSGIRFTAGTDICPFSAAFTSSLGPNLPLYPLGTNGFCPAIKRSVCKADLLSISSTEVKNPWSCDVTPHTSALEWCLE
jgi:hypothetical protein